jgi:hypothetical protein
MADFDAGKLRKYIIAGRSLEDKYTGTNEGPFQVWISHYFPEEPYPARFALEQEVAFYNAKMGLLQQAHTRTLATNALSR